MTVRKACMRYIMLVLALLSCENRADRWQRMIASEAGVVVDLPHDAYTHDFPAGLLVCLRPVSKPLFEDWKYAVEITFDRLPRTEAMRRRSVVRGGSRSADRQSALEWLVAEHSQLEARAFGGSTYFRFDRVCSDGEVIVMTAHRDDSFPAPARRLAAEDNVIREILQSASCDTHR